MTIKGTRAGAQTKKRLHEQIQKHRRELGDWQRDLASRYPLPFYCSVDLRDSGHKIVPVDSNLYPAGFNNICPDDVRTASSVIRTHIEHWAKDQKRETPRKILILPEAHTSNQFYIENLYCLTQILKDAGFETLLGWYSQESGESPQEILLKSATEKTLIAYPLALPEGIAVAGDFVPDLILLNNDFSGGYPHLLDSVKQPILPSHVLGWHSRKKSEHFTYYNQLAAEFASIIGVDPWMIQIETQAVDSVNFNDGQGVEQAAEMAARIPDRTRQAYAKHQIDQKPFVFVKNNAGTYGMGIMVVHEAEELRQMNRRTKNKMSVGKNHRPIQSVIVQEGVPTATLVDRLAAEPVIYLVGGELIGGFLRTHAKRGSEENLNSPGMVFRKLCMSDLRRSWDEGEEGIDESEKEPLLELVYGSVARLSVFATGMELAAHAKLRLSPPALSAHP